MTTWQDRFYQLMSESKFATINDLCKAAGIASSTFGNALKGSHVPKPATMDKVAHALGTTWQYLLNGDEKQVTPDTRVPVLKQDQVQPWIDRKLSLDDCQDIVHAPLPVNSNYFAWKVDADDMEPEFVPNSYIIFDTDVNYHIEHWYHRMFVLVGWMIDGESGQFGMKGFPKEAALSGKGLLNQAPTIQYSDIVVCEVCKTMCGYQLSSVDRRFACSLDIRKHKILAQARYSIRLY